MNYNHLHYFHVIAQEGSIARASRRLNVSQPTLSEQLKHLETFLDEKLFDRKGGALRLNNNGRRALKYTETIFSMGDRLLESFKNAPELAKKRLNIGIVTTASRSIMIERMVDLFKDDEILVRVRQGDNQFLFHELVSSGLDILISDTLPRQIQDKGIEFRVMTTPRLLVIASPQMASGLTVDIPANLHAQPFVHYTTQSSYRWEIDQYFREKGIEPNLVAEADDVYIIREAVRSNVGFGIVPASILADLKEEEEIVVLGELDRNFEIYAMFNRKNPTEQTLKALDILTESMKK